MRYYQLTNGEKQVVKDAVFNLNATIAGQGLLGMPVAERKLAPTKKNIKRFQEQQLGLHQGCGCYGCIELAKTFALATPEIKEAIIEVSTNTLEHGWFDTDFIK